MKRIRHWLSAAVVIAGATAPFALGNGDGAAQAANSSKHYTLNCAESSLCTEVDNYKQVFHNYYVGHDEPSVLFYSNTPGAGNHMRYNLTLPKEPPTANPNAVNKSYTFELNGAIWFGMAICDTQSYPEQVSTCPADSDKNIQQAFAQVIEIIDGAKEDPAREEKAKTLKTIREEIEAFRRTAKR